MLNKIKLLLLKLRLRSYKRGERYYEKIGNYNNWYHENGIPYLEREIFELEHPNQKMFIYCPECGNELISSGSYVIDDVGEYLCNKCGKESQWNFDIAPVPILVKNNQHDYKSDVDEEHLYLNPDDYTYDLAKVKKMAEESKKLLN